MAWLAEAAVAALGRSLPVVYLVPQLGVVSAFAAVWWLARRVVSPVGALLSLVLLELLWPFTFESHAFNANVALLPFWAWTIAFAWSALEDSTPFAWIRLGLALGLGLPCTRRRHRHRVARSPARVGAPRTGGA